MICNSQNYGRPFNAETSFGPSAECCEFSAIVVRSLSEFNGMLIDEALVERIGRRVHCLQKIAPELLTQ